MRELLERRQVPVYLAGLAAGLAIGLASPAAGGALERLIWPALGLLLYATFTQVDLGRLGAAATDRRFLAALLIANFAAVPALVWLLTRPIAADDALLVGVLLVLLAPCIDWFPPFARAGGGDVARALAATPLLLVGQLAALPVYLFLFLGPDAVAILSARPFLEAFAGLILLPLALAAATELWASRRPAGRALVAAMAPVPVPALALVLLVISASQVDAVRGAGPKIGAAVAVYVAYAAAAPFLGRAVAGRLGLGPRAGRTLVFSVGTRNSFVVLPLALGLPEGAALAAAVIVAQSLVELTAMVAYTRLVPSRLLPDPARAR